VREFKKHNRIMNSAEKRTNRELTKRIEMRLAQGWSLEKIGDRTVWHMYGHFYSIKDSTLTVKMAGGNQSFNLPREVAA
jgi:hypothetical protein